MVSDRIHAREFSITQESLAGVLAVRRVSITQAAGHLQRCELIKWARGKVSIVDRKGLEGVSCSCYERIEESQCTIP
jgi:hypothetical protein